MGAESVHGNGVPATVALDTRNASGSTSNAIRTSHGPSCENCGHEAADREIVNNILLCDRCRFRYRLVVAAHSTISWVAFIALAFYAMPHLLADASRNPLLSEHPYAALTGRELLVFYASLVVGVLVHECSHAACARWFGFTVTQIHLGTGPILCKRTVGNLVAVVHIVPFGGLTAWRPDRTPVTPQKRTAVAFAGPLSNLALAGVCWAARSHQPDIAIPAACANLLLFIENIAPRPYIGASGTANDGWQILKNVTNSYWARTHVRRLELVSRYAALLRDGRTSEVIGYLRSEIEEAGDYPDAEALLCSLLLSVRQGQANISEGFERSSRLLYDQRAFPRLRAMVLNNRAYMLAVGGWPNLMAEAEWAAREALRRSPNNVSMSGTLALVLVRLGRFYEAEAIASKVLQHRLQKMRAIKGSQLVELARSAAANRCTLALLYARTNRLDAARRELAEARSLDTSCVLLSELEHVLAAAPLAMVAVPDGAGSTTPRAQPPNQQIAVLAPAAGVTERGVGTPRLDPHGASRVLRG